MQSKRYLALLTACSMALAGTASAGGDMCGACAMAGKGQSASTRSSDQGWQDSFNYDRPSGVVSIWILNPTTGKWEQQNQGGMQGARAEAQTFTGKIEGFRHVSFTDKNNRNIQNTLVKLNLDNGGTVVADLGPRENLSKLNLEKGDQITLAAKAGSVAGRPILFAEKVSHEGSSVKVQRGMDMNRTASSSQSSKDDLAGDVKQLSGKISDYRAVSLKGTDQKHTIVRLETQDGKSKLVDLGPHSLTDLGLDRNDRVSVRGKTAKINGHPVLMAWAIQPVDKQSGTAASGSSGSATTQPSDTATPGRSSTMGEYGASGSGSDASSSSGAVSTPESDSSKSNQGYQDQGPSSSTDQQQQQKEESSSSSTSQPSIGTRDQSAF